MRGVFITVLSMSLTGTLLYAALMLLRPVTRRVLSAAWHYRACVLAVLFLLVPVSVIGGPVFSAVLNGAGSGVPQFSSTLKEIITNPHQGTATAKATVSQGASPSQQAPAGNGGTVLYPASTEKTEAVGPTQTERAPDFNPRGFLSYLPYVWTAGAAAFIVTQVIRHGRFKRRLARTSLPVDDEVLRDLLRDRLDEMGIHKKVALMSSSIVTTPMVTGLLKCVLILPEIEMSGEEVQMVLSHELTHLKRRDILIKLLALLSNAIHWFNPFVYRLRRELGTTCEQSCDERVVATMSAEERRFYGETILNVLCRVTRRREGLFASFAATRRGFEKRLMGILSYKKASKRAAAFSMALLFVFGLAGCAAGGLAGARIVKTNELNICIDPYAKQYLQSALTAFDMQNKDIKVNYTILPDAIQNKEYKPEEREAALAQLRTQIEEGKGPDLFILQADNPKLPALYEDIEKAMRDGVFCDMLPLFREAGISMDDYVAPVMEAGQVQGKQYIVPLNYQILSVVTNDTTRKIMGDDAFKSAEGMLDGLRTMAKVQGAGELLDNSWANLWDFLRDPYYPASPNTVDYDAQTARVDTPLLRDILQTWKSAFVKATAVPAENRTVTAADWKEYAQTERFFGIFGDLRFTAIDMGITENAGMTPHLDAFPSEDGGIRAEVSLYTGIRAGSANKLNAVNMLKMLLSAQYQAKPNEASIWDYGWPVRKGVLAEHLKMYVDRTLTGGITYGTYDNDKFVGSTMHVKYSAPLTEASVNSFQTIESRITTAKFSPPKEIADLLSSYQKSEIDLDTVIARMQDYWDKSLKE